LALAACGGGSEPATTSAPATTPPATTGGTETAATSGGGGQYPAAARDSFLQSCEASATNEQCECALSYLEENVTLDEFIQAGLDISQGKEAPAAITKATENCA
jgi:hypothetical protein